MYEVTIKVKFPVEMSPKDNESHHRQLVRNYLEEHNVQPNQVWHGLIFEV